MNYNLKRGFTLIELLVVIAIIGILSAVVLASLNTARSKGNDAAIQSDLNTIQTQAEIYYGSTGNNSYAADGNVGITCAVDVFSDANIVKAVAGLTTAGGAVPPICGDSTTAYAIAEKLTAPATVTYWCVDSTGFAGTRVTALVAGGTVCPAT
jgi:prepilin-type N-terminal cleavage/methylation domain-containing protein